MTEADAIKERVLSSPWWLVLIEGVAAVVLGILLLAAPGKTLVALISVVGLFFIVKGVLFFAGLFVDRTQWFAKILAGFLSLVAGIIVVQHPVWASALVPTTLSLMVGVLAVAIGIIGLGQAVTGGDWLHGAVGLLSILIGLPFIFNPSGTSTILAPILGIVVAVGGFALIVIAIRLR
jgi:uncharacterized membrane protein HdeD (DUF308 family)